MSNPILISFEQLENFVKGYKLNEQTFGAYNHSGVKGSLIASLLYIHDLSKGNSKASFKTFQKPRTGWRNQPCHKWFTKMENGTITYDTGGYRHDGWATTIITDTLGMFDAKKLGGWLQEQKNSDEIKERIRVCLGYYEAEGNYFRRVINTYRTSGVISEGDYRRTCENKYAQKVWEAHTAEPRFKVGDRVFLRSNAPSVRGTNGFHRAPMGAIVLTNTEAIVSSAKGAKRYKLLPFGHTEPFLAEERQLKKRQ